MMPFLSQNEYKFLLKASVDNENLDHNINLRNEKFGALFEYCKALKELHNELSQKHRSLEKILERFMEDDEVRVSSLEKDVRKALKKIKRLDNKKGK